VPLLVDCNPASSTAAAQLHTCSLQACIMACAHTQQTSVGINQQLRHIALPHYHALSDAHAPFDFVPQVPALSREREAASYKACMLSRCDITTN
jgi:hypothetical protein